MLLLIFYITEWEQFFKEVLKEICVHDKGSLNLKGFPSSFALPSYFVGFL